MIIAWCFTRFYVFTCLWLSIAILRVKMGQKMSDLCRNVKNLQKSYVGRFFKPFIDLFCRFFTFLHSFLILWLIFRWKTFLKWSHPQQLSYKYIDPCRYMYIQDLSKVQPSAQKSKRGLFKAISPWHQICYSADFRLILCTVKNSMPWPKFWGNKYFHYNFWKSHKIPLVWKCISFLDISTISMWKRGTLMI